MITGVIIGEQATVEYLRGISRQVPARIARVVKEFSIDVLADAKRNAPVATGRLRRSLTMKVNDTGDKVEGIIGTNLEYARTVELGFTGSVQVRPFTRKISMVFGRPVSQHLINVSAFTRNVRRAAKPYLVPALNNQSRPLVDRIRAALRDVPGVAQ